MKRGRREEQGGREGDIRRGRTDKAATLCIDFLIGVFQYKGVFEEGESGHIVSQRLESPAGSWGLPQSLKKFSAHSPRLSGMGCAKNVGDPFSVSLTCKDPPKYPPKSPPKYPSKVPKKTEAMREGGKPEDMRDGRVKRHLDNWRRLTKEKEVSEK